MEEKNDSESEIRSDRSVSFLPFSSPDSDASFSSLVGVILCRQQQITQGATTNSIGETRSIKVLATVIKATT